MQTAKHWGLSGGVHLTTQGETGQNLTEAVKHLCVQHVAQTSSSGLMKKPHSVQWQ